MKIENVKIETFKGIDEMDFVPKPVNLFIGPNGSGKSSVLSAIKAGLTNVNERPVQNGKDKASVELEVFGQTITHTYYSEPKKAADVRVGGKKTTQKSVTKLLEDNTGIPLDTAKLLTSGKMLSAIKGGSLADFLISNKLIPVEVDYPKVLSFCPVSPDAEMELSMMLPAAPAKFGMEAIEEAYREFFGQRTAVKKEYQTALAQAKFEGPAPTMSMEVIDKELMRLATETEAIRQYRQQMLQYQKSVERRTEAMNRLAELEKKSAGLRPVKPDEAQYEHLKTLRKTFQEKAVAIQGSISVLNANLEMFRKVLKDLETPICPISEKLKCSTDKTEIKEELSEQAKETEENIGALKKDLEETNEKLRKTEEGMQKYEADLAEFNRIQSLFSEIQIRRQNLPELLEKPTEPVVTADAADRINRLKAERQQIIAYDTAQKAEKKAAELEKKVAVMEELVATLNPKGPIYGKVLEAALTPLTEYCNKRAEMLRLDFQIGIEIRDGICITCQPTAKAGFIDIADVSSGEQLLATFLITDMLNALSGFGILLIDDLDKLDEKAFASLLKLITTKEVLDGYDHIFITSVDHKDIREVADRYGSEIQIFKFS